MGDEPTSMTPAPSEQSVFAEANLLATPEARAAYLDTACGADRALRQRVEALLRAAENAGDFMEEPPTGLSGDGSTLPIEDLSEKPGDKIGRYKLLQQIGEGGCGVVYLAEQLGPVRRRVALKVIKLGMDTKSVIARFEAEQQALALMDHPNIAKVFDAGATGTGRPYFVMELVRGIKITDYCDQNSLSTEERLKLFTQVCQAIQHAHQKGIIHRDIKPSNILVTRSENEAVPKVIDFGIAKATTGQRLTDKTVFTAFEQFIGTPAYMSPEQAMMTSLDIDTRTDIYALGVLLYELLTGQTPFDAKELMSVGLDAMRRTIREQEPARPSTRLSTMLEADLTTVARHRHSEPAKLGNLLRGDLDWIVMKALEKDRTRRYETASGLAMDIQRHLDNEPVTARPPSRLYEFQKTVRRHKFGFVAATALILALGLGVLASSWQALRARRAEREQVKLRQEAEADKHNVLTEAAKSRQVAQFMQDMLKGVGPAAALGRDTAMLREILDKTAGRIANDLQTQPDVEAELRNTIGNVYWEIGDWEKSAAMHSQALAIRRKLFGNEDLSVATSLHGLAEALRQQSKLAEAEAAFRESLAIRRKLLGNEHPDVAQSLNHLGSLLSIQLKDDEPEALLREAVAIRRKVLGNEHGDVGTSLDNLAHVLNRRGKTAEAIAMHYEALAIRKRFFGDQHPELVYSYLNLAAALEGQGNLAEAERMLRNAISLCDTLLGQQHPEMPHLRLDLARVLRLQGKLEEAEQFRREPDTRSQTVAASLHEAGNYLQLHGRLAEAETNYRESLAVKRGIWGNVHREIADELNVLAQVLTQQRKLAEAELIRREELVVRRKLLGNEHAEVATTLHKLAEVLRESGQLTEAEQLCRETLALRRKLRGNQNEDVGHALHLLAWTLHLESKDAEAETLSREELALRRKLFGNEHPEVAWTLQDLTTYLQVQNRLIEAEATAREALTIRRKALGREHPETAESLKNLADMLKREGKLTEAEAVWREELEARRKVHGSDSLKVAIALDEFALFLRNQGKLSEAETSLRESLAIRRERLGSAHPNVADTLHQLAWTRHLQGDDVEAVTLYREALGIRRKHLDTEPHKVVWALYDLSIVLRNQGKLVEAESAAREAAAVRKDLPGNGHPEVAATVMQLAEVLELEGRCAEAKPLFLEAAVHANADTLNEIAWRMATSSYPELRDGARAVAYAEKAVAGTNRKNPMILDTLAAASAETGQFAAAIQIQEEAMSLLPDEESRRTYALRLKVYQANLPYRSHRELVTRAKALLAEGKFSEAETSARECLVLRELLFPDAWQTFNARNMLGGSLLGQKKYVEAESFLRSGYEGMKQREDRIPPAGQPRIKETLQRLVQLYEATGRPQEAARWKRKLEELNQSETAKEAVPARP